jgi:hypothetical protein
LLFEHPTDSAVWTSDRQEWAGWVDDYVDVTPDAEVSDFTDQYSITIEEFERVLREVEA